jgi:hypothetical protein
MNALAAMVAPLATLHPRRVATKAGIVYHH